MTRAATIAGLVLAGGNATRMGGGDKTLLTLGGQPMLAHILERLDGQAGPIAISANGDPARFADFGCKVLPDPPDAERRGPLSGVLAGLRWAARTRASHLLTAAGDTPFLPADLVSKLEAALTDDAGAIAVATSRGQPHPVFALWPLGLAQSLEAFLSEGTRGSVLAFLRGHPVRETAFADRPGGIDPFYNVNTPADLAQAEALLRRISG